MKKIFTQQILERLLKDIEQFRRVFKLAKDDFTPDDEIYHTSLAVEELTELAQATTLTEQADALCDLLYVQLGRIKHLKLNKVSDEKGYMYLCEIIFQTAQALNIDLLKCWDIVHASNMSKICANHREYQETAQHYRTQGIRVEPDASLDGIIVKCAEDVTVDGKFIKQGKVLKSLYYHEAVLDPVPLLNS